MIGADGAPRGPYQNYFDWYSSQDPARLLAKSRDAENIFRKTGITFAVYGHADSAEKLIPFDIIPRIISGREWRKLAQGIEQRVLALNAFLDDIYHKQEIIRAGRIPRELIENNVAFLPEMIGFRPPGGVYTHIVGIDLVRTGPDEFFVLEDNARTPSGVSYMLENRETMMGMFPDLFSRVAVESVSNYPRRLARSLAEAGRVDGPFPQGHGLSDGPYGPGAGVAYRAARRAGIRHVCLAGDRGRDHCAASGRAAATSRQDGLACIRPDCGSVPFVRRFRAACKLCRTSRWQLAIYTVASPVQRSGIG